MNGAVRLLVARVVVVRSSARGDGADVCRCPTHRVELVRDRVDGLHQVVDLDGRAEQRRGVHDDVNRLMLGQLTTKSL